jgi:hypothetical protein
MVQNYVAGAIHRACFRFTNELVEQRFIAALLMQRSTGE